MRLLYPGSADGRQGAARPHVEPQRGRGPRGTRGESLPLWLLRTDHQGGARCSPDVRMSSGPVGSSPYRVGGIERVTGHQKYVADIRLADALNVKLVTLDCARARIISVDTAKAELVPGVVMIMTADDLPQPVPRFGPQFQDRPVLAVGETKYHGEAVGGGGARDQEGGGEGGARGGGGD